MMMLKTTLYLLPLLSLTLALTGCGTLADRRESQQTAQAVPDVSATVALTAPTDSIGVTLPAPATEVSPVPLATSAPLPTALPVASTATVAAAPVDTSGEALLTLLDQLGTDLQSEDGGVEQDLP